MTPMTQTPYPRPTSDEHADHRPGGPADQPRWPVWLKVVLTPVIFLTIVTVGVLPLLPFETALQSAATEIQLVVQVASHVVVLVLAAGVLWLMARFIQRVRLGDVGVLWSRRSLQLLGFGLAISIAITVPAGLLLQELGLLRDYFEPNTAVPAWMEVAVMLSMAFFLQGIPEEWFFRGWILRVMGHRPVRAIWTSAILFGVIHIISEGPQENLFERLVYVAMATAFGLSCAVLAVQLRSVWVAAGIHAGIHVANIIGTLLGMGQGPWLWGVIAVGHLLVGLVAMRLRPLPSEVTFER
ncbi:MAG: type II CAAX endopeptidase family protein [Actinomycetia bacterium]|nr:type II CAAX endopeptidase family protein [Actinomycetes bacterium]